MARERLWALLQVPCALNQRSHGPNLSIETCRSKQVLWLSGEQVLEQVWDHYGFSWSGSLLVGLSFHHPQPCKPNWVILGGLHWVICSLTPLQCDFLFLDPSKCKRSFLFLLAESLNLLFHFQHPSFSSSNSPCFPHCEAVH